jgi:hypothetical protein
MSIIANLEAQPAWPSENVDISKVAMGPAEALKIEEYVKSKSKVLEWGSGGSTLYFSKFVDTYVSIEHDVVWYDEIKFQLLDNVELHYVPTHGEKLDEDLDTYASGVFSGPGMENKIDDVELRNGTTYWTTRGRLDWHCYMDYLKKPLELEYRDYDVIIIDGRSRAMCGYVATRLLKEDGYLLFHDFNHRTYYHGILKYYKVVDTVESLAILVKK